MRNDSGEILRRVQAGESFLVTNDGVPTAVLSPYVEDVVDRLVRTGAARSAAGPLRAVAPPQRVRQALSSEEVLAQDRQDR